MAMMFTLSVFNLNVIYASDNVNAIAFSENEDKGIIKEACSYWNV